MRKLLAQPSTNAERIVFYGVVGAFALLIPVVRVTLNLPPTLINWTVCGLIAGTLGGFAGAGLVALLRRTGL